LPFIGARALPPAQTIHARGQVDCPGASTRLHARLEL